MKAAGSEGDVGLQQQLEDAIQQYQEQLEALDVLLADHPEDQEAQQVHAELTEALAATHTAYAACFPEKMVVSQDQQDPAAVITADTASVTAAAAATAQQGYQEAVAAGQPCAAVGTAHKPQADTQSTGKKAAIAAAAAQPTGNAASQQTVRVPFTAQRPHPRMHPDNIYSSQGAPDFAALAQNYPPLAPYLTIGGAGRAFIDFTSWDATKELTAALLAIDFGVQWQLPEGQLIPPVPNRANYIHWIHDLLQLSAPEGTNDGVVHGLDIGCGANFIYCLLGAAIYNWYMVGVDVTEVALQGAAAVRDANPHLLHLLEARRSHCNADQTGLLVTGCGAPAQAQMGAPNAAKGSHGPLMGAVADDRETFHFCVCNPPFFESIEEANQNPATACGGSAAEMVCPGGELAFITAMIRDSQQLQGRVHWYSSMCGKKQTLKTLRQELHMAGVSALRTTELAQGRTIRWAIAWSFAANPNTANMPLPRRQASQSSFQDTAQLQQQSGHKRPRQDGLLANQPAGRPNTAPQAAASSAIAVQPGSAAAAASGQVSFAVTAAVTEGKKVLQAVVVLLQTVGKAQQVRLDAARWTVICNIPPTTAPAVDVGAGAQNNNASNSQQQQHQQQHHNNLSSRQQQVEQQQQQQTKVSHQAAELIYLPVKVSVCQQRPGLFIVAASVLQDVLAMAGSGSSSSRLLNVMQAVQEDLALMWEVGPLL